MDYGDIDAHVIRTTGVEPIDGGTRSTRECACGWWTIADDPEPDHHTPLAEREAAHLEEVDLLSTGAIWNRVPNRFEVVLSLRRRASDNSPNWAVLTAVWQGGFQDVTVYPWDAEGLEGVRASIVKFTDVTGHAVCWWRSGRVDGPVDPDSLARHIY